MQISLNIILDVLQSYQLETHFAGDHSHTFAKCLPLPDDLDELSSECLYVGLLSRALAIGGADADFHCICLRDRIKDDHETGANLCGLIIVNENMTITSLFTLVQNRFFKILDWIQKMHETLIRNGTMQEILDLCAPIIDNYIAVSDSSLTLMAYTREIACDDPICTALVQHGYFPEEIIQIFRKYDLFKIWEMTEAPYYDGSCEVAKYPTYHYIFKFGNTYFAHIVMTCNRSPLTASMTDLFGILIDVLAVYIERAWEDKNTCNHIYDTFLTDMIDGAITNKAVIEERAQYVGIPLTGNFYLFQIVPNDAPNISIGKMLIDFSELFPRVKFIRYQQRIVAINNFYSKDFDTQLDQLCAMMETFLSKYDALCGVSAFFTDIEELEHAFLQSTLALKYIHQLRGGELIRNIQPDSAYDARVHFFDKKYFFCLLGEYSENAQMWYHSAYHAMLLQLHQYDQRHKSNNLQLLHVYLNCERNATESANQLNMHRNNVTYHINRIQEMLNVAFDDPLVRLMMLVSYYLLELYGFKDD